MSDRERQVTRSLWRARAAARAPKALAVATIAVLCLVGLRSALAAPSRVSGSARTVASQNLAAESFAEAFARAYLTWDGSERHARRVAAFVSDDFDAGAGLSLPRHRQQVLWTSVVQDRPVAGNRREVTVAVDTNAGPYYLSVPVEREEHGLVVPNYPALVGALPAATHSAASDEPEVEDTGLRSVVRRAVTNYLAREGVNLRADLDPSAVVALPPRALAVHDVDAITWAGARRVAVQVRAEGVGATWALRYELDVVRRERWYVRSIDTNPRERRPR